MYVHDTYVCTNIAVVYTHAEHVYVCVFVCTADSCLVSFPAITFEIDELQSVHVANYCGQYKLRVE